MDLLTKQSDSKRKDIVAENVPDIDPKLADPATGDKEKVSKKERDKQNDANQNKSSKSKSTRQSRQRDTIKIDDPKHLRSRSKSAIRNLSAVQAVSRSRSKSPSNFSNAPKPMVWDGKSWKEIDEDKKGSVCRRGTQGGEDEEKSHKSDKSEMDFMDAKQQEKLLDKLLG